MKTLLIIAAISIIMLFSQCSIPVIGGYDPPEPCYETDDWDEEQANFFPYIKYDTIYFKCLNETDSFLYFTCNKEDDGWLHANIYDINCENREMVYYYYKQYYSLQSNYDSSFIKIENKIGFTYAVNFSDYTFFFKPGNVHELYIDRENGITFFSDSLKINQRWFYNVYKYSLNKEAPIDTIYFNTKYGFLKFINNDSNNFNVEIISYYRYGKNILLK